jgi:hypothetical protein
VVGSRRIFEFDSNALTYINAVEAADGQALEFGVKVAVNSFVVGCKADGIWTAIKASCILAGAKTLSGALTPLAGAAPSGFNLASGTYSRTAGITFNPIVSGYIDTNRPGDADPQNNVHLSLFQIAGVVETLAGNRPAVTGPTYIDTFGSGLRARARTTLGTDDPLSVVRGPGIIGFSRTASSAGTIRGYGVNYTMTTLSQTPQSESVLVSSRRNTSTGNPEVFASGTICFYSVGESLNLALLDARVSGLMVAISGAIS